MWTFQVLLYGLSVVILPLILIFFRSTLLRALWNYKDRQTVNHGLQSSKDAQFEEIREESLQLYKELYFKLHNLEEFPEILTQARNELIDLFSSAILSARSKRHASILRCPEYSPIGLRRFLMDHQDKVFVKWEQYTQHRKKGGSRQMFQGREEAIHWLKQMAPLKYVDGAWLGYVSRDTLPFHFHKVVKDLWQVLSEEFGDGDLAKHHVYIYRNLMQKLVPELPEADSIAFINPSLGLDDMSAWRGAVAQLLISLFSHEFLPEIIGFNLHFECITLETLVVARELREVDIDPYYFTLHASIDNADTGHTAIALHAAEQYLDKVEQIQGTQAKNEAWKRIQIGFVLSEYLGETSSVTEDHLPHGKPRTSADTEKRFLDIVRSKCAVAGKLHCGCNIRLGTKSLTEWLDPILLSNRGKQSEFVRILGSTSHLVSRGNSSRSRLIKELSWGGKMFGSFTDIEVDIVKDWIDSLDPRGQPYWSYSGRSATKDLGKQWISMRSSALLPPKVLNYSLDGQANLLQDDIRTSKLDFELKKDVTNLLPLWFAHPCLLQFLISIPFKSMSNIRCDVLRILRAQAGFGTESIGVAGMDEVKRTDTAGLLELGLEMAERQGLAAPQSLEEALESWSSDFASDMLRLSTLPNKNIGLLFGLTWAFVDLHDSVASQGFLSRSSCITLLNISQKERGSLIRCIHDLKHDDAKYLEVRRGYTWGVGELKSILR